MALPVAGYGAVISATGVSTVDSSEPAAFLSGTGANQIYQVTATSKRVWDPTVAVTVKDGSTTLTPGTQYVFNYLFGTIQFVAYTPVGAITVTGNYLPIVPAILCSKFEINQKSTLVDVSNFDSGQAVNRIATIVSYEGTISTFDPLNNVLDGVAGTWQTWLEGLVPKLITFNPGTGNYFRCWTLLESLKTSTAVAGAIEGTVNWKSIQNQLPNATFGWGT